MALKRIASTTDVPAGEVRVFEVEGCSIALANVAGEFLAIDNLCTHDGGPLGDGTLWNAQVECPRHGARFDMRTGRAVTLPAVRGVKTYSVQVEGDEVQVDI
jgi:3-phenylpropionate/trans-cinnamate dioxygenase ferredoxin subunit